jgi:hypothetical protein
MPSPPMPEVSPDLAEKVLSADLRNVIKKVGDGSALSPTEREMMERYLAEDLQKVRAAALLRRWATGGKLNKGEQQEIRAFVGSASPATETTEAPSRLRSDQYQQPLRVYANQIWPEKRTDNSVRTLKRWVALGREADPQDFPPFDQPDQLAAWFERHHTWKAPDDLKRFEAGAETGKTAVPPVAESPGADPEEAALPPMPPMLLDLDADMTADVGLQQVKTLVQATFNQMQVALKRENMTAYNSLRREWQQLVGILRQWEKDIVKIQEGRGDVLRTRVINTELVRIFTTIGQSFFNSLLKVLDDHAPQLPADERRRIALDQRDLAFLHLKGSRFETAWTASP